MKHYILTLLCLVLSSFSYSQIDVSVSSLSGYESNILRAPNQIFIDDELLSEDEIYKSSFYQDIVGHLKYKKEARKSLFKISVKPQKRFFFSESESNRLIADFKLTYRLDIGKNSSWENSTQYFIKDQNGLDADENELGTTFGYNVVNLDSKLNFRLFENNRSFIGAHYGKKNFDPTETREVSYYKYGVNAGFKTVKWKNHLLRSSGINASFIQRQYNIETVNEDDDFNKEHRTWNLLSVRGFYKMQLSKTITIYPSLAYTKRLDLSDDRFGYNEITPKLYVSYSKEKLNLSLLASYAKRNFTDLIVNDNDLLSYDYLRLKCNTSYKFSNHWSFVSQAYFIDRGSNNENLSSMIFRSYNNYYLGIGLKYTF
ncbi:MAG: hypothetical protein HRU50_06675 [Winogradskyella sp.]|uniref:transporter n=1 Tax=Winogradskyella sp. TaxID=1883156 RepID=UPI0025D022B9|nr:transporter [Winogradskyella sp.]NRB59615.1 hypothetical protein [Winogradskyella sp.]